jgi:hypothetical protein
MRDQCASDDCGGPLTPGEQVIQLTTGKYVLGYVTPYLTPDETHNWHPGCFREFSVKEQSAPYSCANCNQRLENGDRVLYACRGAMPDRGYFRAESRGHIILYIAHVKCKS